MGWRRGGGLGAAVLLTVALVPLPQAASAQPSGQGTTAEQAASRTVSAATSLPRTAEAARAAAKRPLWTEREGRSRTPEDRYAPAGGCYTLASVATGGHLAPQGGELRALADADDGLRLHAEATRLGHYLLYSPEERFVGAPEGALADLLAEITGSSPGAMASGLTQGATEALAAELGASPLGDASGRGALVGLEDGPGPLTDWELLEDGDAFRLQLVDGGPALTVTETGTLDLAAPVEGDGAQRFTLHLAEGCAAFPDVEVGVTGPVVGGETPYGTVRGYADPHVHHMAFEFLGGRARCGRPWHPYGVTEALQGCPEHEQFGGRTHVLEAFLSGRDPVEGHDTTGWPTFAQWPEHDSLTYEQTYHRWVERAWRSGLRQMTVLLVDNNVLCTIYPFTRNSCNEMDAVRLQAERAREFEAYIDAQHGGPGQGWYRIVEDPFEARRVMNEGKLAVTLGIEVSVLFDCSIDAVTGEPICDEDDIDRQLDEVYELGVRQMELVNKSDSGLGGVAGDAGETGVLTNAANFYETGSFLRMGDCDDLPEGVSDRQQINLADDAPGADGLVDRDGLFGLVLAEIGGSGVAPVYGPGPHCNELGLTELGEHTLRGMVERGMIFDPDHLSARARQDAMAVIEELGYSGIMSTHSWADDDIYERVLRAGGFVTPIAMRADRFVAEWLKHRAWADERYLFAFGVGSDVNGFATQPGPRGAGVGEGVSYPFEGFGGVTVDRQVSGERVFDINEDGVAHYGLYPDWIEDLRVQAGDAIVADLERGGEAYLQTWERAVGVAPDACRPDVEVLDRVRVRSIDRGTSAEEVLLEFGQPRSRDGARFTYCVAPGGVAQVVFDDDGRVTRVTGAGGPPPAQPGPTPMDADDVASIEASQAATAARVEAGEVTPEVGHVHLDEILEAVDAASAQAASESADELARPAEDDAAATDRATAGEGTTSTTPPGAAAAADATSSSAATAPGAGAPVAAPPVAAQLATSEGTNRGGPLRLALLLLGVAAIGIHRAHVATRETVSRPAR